MQSLGMQLDDAIGPAAEDERTAPSGEPESQIVAPPISDPAIDPGLIEEILARVRRQIEQQRLPISTYRLQFTGDFTFAKAAECVEYLHELGITELYASPLFQAREHTQSGYDVADCSRLSEDLGTAEDFERLALALREREMGLILDIVPNHMTTASPRNRWWLDVLENGPLSPYATFFDIDWMPLKPDLANKILLPTLGDQYGKVLETGQLQLQQEDGAFSLNYHSWRFPLAPGSYALILTDALAPLEAQLGGEHADVLELHSILTAVRNLPGRTETDPTRIAEYHREKEFVKHRLRALLDRSSPAREALAASIRGLSGEPGDPRSFDRLDELIGQQAYRLAHWQVAADEINYRRFFDVNELAAICVEHREVFEQTHRLVFELLDRGLITGLRIDHPDGLFDPRGYLRQLQETQFWQLCRAASSDRNEPWSRIEGPLRAAFEQAPADSPLARPVYVAVEKILTGNEPLPGDWPVHGTVGYEFLNRLSGLFVDAASEAHLSTTYQRFTSDSIDFRELAYRCKRLIVRMSMASELQVLGYRLDRISERNRWTRDFTLNSLTRALQEVAACFTVYRTYVTQDQVPDSERHFIEAAVARAKRHNRAMSASIFDFVRDALLLRYRDNADQEERQAQWQFVGKFQQLTGPIMAKGVEDTAFYRFNRLVSLNEVGGEPDRFGCDVAAFHKLNASRLPPLSRGLSSTSTHDMKRSEDVRARIHVLSEVPQLWRKQLTKWSRWNRRFRTDVEGQSAPAAGDEYLLYQTLLGFWPDPVPHGEERERRIKRVQNYMLKVVREAKLHTSWISPYEPYERAVTSFVAEVLNEHRRGAFLADIQAFANKIADHGYWNSLSQLLLKVASPGVPDFYQGTETWSLTLVDPDNRQPIDFASARQRIDELQGRLGADGSSERRSLLSELVEQRQDGRIKLFTTLMSLRARRSLPELFTEGDYLPLAATGPRAEHLVAIARRRGPQWAIAVAPRLTAKLCGFGGPPPLGSIWQGTTIELPAELSGVQFHDAFSGETRALGPGSIDTSELLANFPLVLFTGSSES